MEMPIYPRMLFPSGDATQEPLIVNDEGQEVEAREGGYAIAGEQGAEKPAKRGRKSA